MSTRRRQRGARERDTSAAEGSAHLPRHPHPVELKLRVVREVLEHDMRQIEVARLLGLSKHTVWDWVQRFRERGVAGLVSEAPGPRGGAGPGAAQKRAAVTALRRAHPEYGTRRISAVLARFAALGVSETAVRTILHEAGLLRARPPAAPAHPQPARRFERAEPNQLWQSDLFTFLLRRHERLYLVAFLDDHSRFVVAWALAHHQKTVLVLEALARGIAAYGAPREILTDQGTQYHTWRGESAFAEELRRQGIRQLLARPQHPETCGKIERFWKTLWEEFLSRTVFADYADCERRLGLFVQHYNFQRPHRALGGLVPADRFFRAAPHVRAAIEAGVAANALRLARAQPPQTPFYLVGRLGDQDLSIAAAAGGLHVQMGPSAQRITLGEEGPHGDDGDDGDAECRAERGAAAPPPAAPGAAGAQVAADAAGPGRDRDAAVPDDPECARGRATGDRGARGGGRLAGDVLPAGGTRAAGDADGALPPGGPRGHGAGGPGGRADGAPCAGGEGAAAGAGEAAGGAAALRDPQAGEAGAGGGARSAGPAAGPATLDPTWAEWVAALTADADESESERLDPDAGWRGRAVRWARKLIGATAAGGVEGDRGEAADGEAADDVRRGTPDGGGAAPAVCGGAADRERHADGARGGAAARTLAAADADPGASQSAGAGGGAGAAGAGAAGDAAAGSGAPTRDAAAAPGERAAAAAAHADGAGARAGGGGPAGADRGDAAEPGPAPAGDPGPGETGGGER